MAKPLDESTLEACRILADAVRRERVSGVVEFIQLERSLGIAIEERTQSALATADDVFRALDQDVRKTIAGTALGIAQATVKKSRGAPAKPTEEDPVTLTRPPRPLRRPRQPSGIPALLAAVNRMNQTRDR